MVVATAAGCADRGPGDGLSKVPDGVSVDRLRELAGEDGALLFATRSPDGRGVDEGLTYELADGTLIKREVVALCRAGVVVKFVEWPTTWHTAFESHGRYSPADVRAAHERIAELWREPSLPPEARRFLGTLKAPASPLEVYCEIVTVPFLPLALVGLPVWGPIALYQNVAANDDRQHWRPDRVRMGDAVALVRNLYGEPFTTSRNPDGVDVWEYRPPNGHDEHPIAPFTVVFTGGRVSLVLGGDLVYLQEVWPPRPGRRVGDRSLP